MLPCQGRSIILHALACLIIVIIGTRHRCHHQDAGANGGMGLERGKRLDEYNFMLSLVH